MNRQFKTTINNTSHLTSQCNSKILEKRKRIVRIRKGRKINAKATDNQWVVNVNTFVRATLKSLCKMLPSINAWSLTFINVSPSINDTNNFFNISQINLNIPKNQTIKKTFLRDCTTKLNTVTI